MELIIDEDIYLQICKELAITEVKLAASRGNSPPATKVGYVSWASYYPRRDEIVLWLNNLPGDPSVVVSILLHELRHAWQRKHRKIRFYFDAYVNRGLWIIGADWLRKMWYEHCWVERDARRWASDNQERYLSLVDKAPAV